MMGSAAHEASAVVCFGLLMVALCSVQLPVGCHTGYKWAELAFPTG